MANNDETKIENPFNSGGETKKKDKPQQQPNYAELVEVGSEQPNYGELVEVNKGIGGHLKDFGTSLASGAASLPDIALGIGDLYTGGRVGKAVEDSGVYTPGSGSDFWRDQKTINAKAQEQEFAAADGILEKTGVALSNPTMITNAIGESLAPMALGGLAGRGINVASKGKIGAAAAGAMGEGAVMAGSQAENIRQKTEDGLLTPEQTALAAGTGVLGAAFGYMGGRVAQKLGFDDVDSMMANGVRTGAVQEAAKDIPISSIPKSILAGAVSEGILEELPQSVAEQALQNIALGKDWTEGLDDAIVMGTLAGMAMGGGINAYTSTNKYLGQERPEDNTGAQNNGEPNLPMLPGGNGALEGEFIPGQRGQTTTDAQGRTTYEYDQFSTDAANRLEQGTGFNPTQGSNPGQPDNPIAPTTPPLSRQLGINPEEGPLSTAAAMAVDSGATATMLNAPPITDASQNDVNNNTPLSTAAGLLNAPNENSSSNESGTGSSNNGPLGETSNSQLRETSGSISTVANSNADDSKDNNLERPGDTALLSNTIGNDGKDTSGRKDSVNSVSGIGEPSQAAPGQSGRNNLNTIGNNSVLSGENEAAATSSSTIGTTAGDSQNRTVEPILGADGKNKWFGNQEKAQAFIDKKNLGNDYQVVQDGKRFEIQPKQAAQNSNLDNQNTISNAENNIDKTQKIADLEQQLATEKSVPKKAQIRKQIAELQNGLADQAQSEVSLDQPRKATAENLSGELKRMEQATARVNAARQRMREANPEIFTAENDRVRETHGLTNARVTSIADEIETSGNYELSDREYEKIKNNPNYKIDYDARNFMGKVTAVKDPHSGEWVGNNEQTDLNDAAVPVQDDAYFQSKIDDLDKQRAQFEAAGDQANAEKVYDEMQTVAREWQTNSSTATPTTKRAEPSKGAADKAWGDFYRKNRNMMSDELFAGGHQDRNTLEEAAPEIQSRHAHGMAKATPAAAIRDLKDILENDIDQNRGQGRLFTAPLSQGKLTAEQRSAMSQSGTSSGSAYSDGAFTLIAKDGVGDIRSVSEIDAVMVNSAVPQEVVDGLRQDFPGMKIGYANELQGLLSGSKQSNNSQSKVADIESQHPVNKWQEEMNKALEKADPEHPLFKKLQASAKNGLKSVSDRAVALRQAREIEKKADAPKTEKPKVEPEQPKVKVSENKFVTDERRAELEKRIKAKLSQLNSGVDPELIVLGTELALYHIERGVRTFAAYAKAMTESLGDSSKPFLKSWYMGVKYDPRASGFDGMSSAAEVESFDLSDLDLELGKMKLDLGQKYGENNVTFSEDKKFVTVKTGDKTTYVSIDGDIKVVTIQENAGVLSDKAYSTFGEVIQHIDRLNGDSALKGKTETVVTPAGREFEVQHKVVEAADLITSNLDSGAINSEYPQALQPRDRTTLKSITQVNDIANKLNPKLLGDSASSTNGAPIVSPGNEVESGNGRTLAIRKAYQTGKADAYKDWLSEQGYDVANMQQPVLVRERITPMNMAERVAYTTESNERETLDMSPSEQAMSDAPKVMDILHLVQGGSFNNTANRDFVNAFLTGVASKNERGTMLDKDGVSLTQDGYRRIESALLAAAFNDAQIINQVIESKDSDIKAIGNALIEAAPQWAQVRKGVQEGILVEGVNVEANLVEAVHLVRKARQQNLSLSEMLNQDDIFDGSIDQVTKDFISIFYSGDKLNKARSSQKVADALKSYAQLAMTAKASPNLFGDAPLSNEQILGQVNDRLKQSEAEKQQDFFSSEGTTNTNPGKSSQVGQGPETSQPDAAATQSAAVTRTPVERPKNDTTLVQDWGVKYVDGWATNADYPGKVETDYGFKDGVKAAFLKDSKKYLEAVQKNLESIGYELHQDKKGKPKKVSVNESGVAGSGEAMLYIREPITGVNVYMSIGDGRPGSHPQRIGIMYRATMKESDKQASGFGIENSGNQYTGANTSAFEMAQMIDDMVTALVKRNQNKENSNERSTSSPLNPQGTSAVRSEGRASQQGNPPANNSNVETGGSATGATTGTAQTTGRSGLRGATANVANDGQPTTVGNESNGRKGTSGTTELSTEQPTKLESPAAVANTAKDFHMSDPDLIFGGNQKQRFNKNKAALELLEELNNEGRQATPEEQMVLASYTGWGSFGQDLFQGTWNTPIFKDDWKDQNLWLREKLGKESWESAKDSILNAFFTDPYTVKAMWSMAEKMGFTGGRVLEPAVGTGNFISLMPYGLKQRSQVTAIDLDITTAAIAKQLFPESNVQNMPYQKSKTPDNFYDLVISNVPFSNDVKIADRRYNQFNPNLHDYYFLKMLDQVRPGGIVMAITSSGTMDKQSEVIRREIAKQAELMTSVRLPAGAFKDFAGTNVVTDIIVLRKRAEPLAMTPELDWIGLSEVKTSTKPVKVNSFYANNLRNVLGTIDYKGGDPRFAGMTVHSPGEAALKKQLETLSDLVPENALLPRHNDDYLTYYANKAGERTNTLTMSNGELMFVYGDQMVKATDVVEYKIKDAKKTAQRQKSIEDLVEIRKAYTDLTDAERIEQDNVEQLRKSLNKLYQAYVKAHGPLADSFGLQYFKKMEDAYYYSLAALENNGKPAEILKRSVVRGAAALQNPTVADAFVVERNKSAAPSLANIAKMANVPEDQARAELLAKGAVYVLPNGEIMPSDMYLSGNVRLKLEEAQNAVAEGNADLQRNVDALKEIIPEDIPYFNIEAKMGATWVPLSDYEKYIANMLGMTDSNGITVTFPSGKWKVKLDNNASRRTEASTNYGTKYKSFQTVVSAALSNQNITVKYKNSDGSESVDVQATEEVNEKISKIKEDFATWLWSDPERRVQLEKEYNHAFNAWATPKYDGSFMSMQGMALSLGNGPFNLRQHQQNAIWRAIVNRRSINAHEVGTGKTFTMGGIALESRRYGIAKKPLILAHNANSAAVAKEIQMMYPSARVLFISELGKAVRQIRMRQIANDDWDVVVMPHSMIDKLTLSEETLMAMAADDIAALEAELEEALAEEGGATLDEVLAMDSESVNKKMGFKNPTAKQLAKQRLKLLEDIQKQAMDSSKADAVNFEELGVDMIMVDEVHEFKKPSIATRMNMKGLNTSSNKRSVNLQLLTRYVRRMNNGGNVHTFTGTPITNTLTEIYHQMRYVMEEEMQKLNVAAWDGWFGSFATDITDIELSATGEYQLVTRLAGFVNVPELRKMIGQFMDIVFANDMPEMQPRRTKTGKVLSDEGLTEAEKAELLNGRTEDAKDRPYKKVMNITTEMSPKQEETLKRIQDLAKEWERASGKEKRKWMRDGDPRAPLSISTAAKKASYDARIGDPDYVGQEGLTQDYEMSKASQVVKNVMEVYNSHPLASQVIFADTGYNTTTERSTGTKDAKGKMIRERVKVFSPIRDIVERLVQSGIPREQIAIVNGDVKAEARKAIADKVNTGEIRVVIGLTQTLGVGVNMQKNLRAMHHLDAPWMPGELEQRNGRGLRQGNQWNTVLEYRYITDKLDGKSWQVLAIKDRFINSFMKADGSVRSIEGDAAADNGEDNGGDIMSSFSEASGDPRVLQRIKMKEKLEKLQRKERLHTQGIADMRRTIGNTQRRIERFNEQLAEYENNAILDRIQTLMKSQSENFSVEVDGTKYDKHKEASEAIQQFIADHVRTGSTKINLGKYGNVTLSVQWDSLQPQATLSMQIGPIEFKGNTLRGIEGKLRSVNQDIQSIEDAKVSAQDTINSLSKAVDQPFGQADQLTRTQKQLESIEQDLEQNPVAPPIWLRRGAPIETEVYYKGNLFIVSGHRYTNDGWFVSADDAKGSVEIPYMEATDSTGMPIYEEREFEAPNIEDKTKTEEVKQPKESDTQEQEGPLYSRKSGNQKTGKTVDQVRDALINRFGQEVIESLEKQGKLRIAQSYETEGVEGFYHNGRVTLIADNLNDDSIIPTFLHELGGHGGFQNMMSKDKYAELMRQFDDLVKRGHPMAKAAKELAEREAGTERQQLEYLPYLLTLASTMQTTNALQRNALQRFMDRLVAAVKAWAFDQLGININLTPNDMVALAERMVSQALVENSAQKVRAEYQGTAKWMKAPNGKNTNLSEQQWLQVRTPEFKNWFGDWENDPQNASEVLDENGEPKVVYHGTAAQFTEFKLGGGLLGRGIYLTDNLNTAEMYANIRSNTNAGVVMPLFVNMRNSFKTNGTAKRDEIVAATETGEYQGILHSFENDEILVALDPTQVKMAIGNAGTFDSTDPSVLFSRQSANMQAMLQGIVGNMNKQGANKLKQQAAFKFKDSLQYLLQGLGRRQLVEVYSKILPQLEKYNILAAQMDADKNEAGANADELVVRWSKIKDEQQLAELMHEATLAKIDPDKPYVSGDSVSKYKKLRDDFRALSPEAQQMYRDARDAYKKHHRDVLNAIKERIMRASIDNAKKAELMQQMDDNFFHSLKGVYFPLSRFGKYVIIVRKPNGEVESVNRAETMKEAEALRQELIGMFPNSSVEKVIRDKAFNASRDMVGRGFMSNLFEELEKFGLPASKQAELEDILGQLYLSSLPDLSWAKHGIHRKGTAGFSQDARRAFAQNMFHGASYLAKLRYADVMAEQLDEMQKHADQRKNDPNYDQPIAQAVIDEMNKRHESLMAPDSHPLSSTLTSLGFIYFLGLSVASGAVNLMQTALVAYPQMGAKWGFDNAFKELSLAAGQSLHGLNDISKSLQGDELKAYSEAVRRGVIDVTQAHDLAGIAQGEDSGVMWKLRPIMRWASFIFHQAERFNREVTFVAAYRLAKQAGSKHDQAFEQAMKATYDGHFDYSSGNRPRIMQGNVAKVILLFKQFGQNMLYTMLRSLHQSFKAETPKARREALRALSGIMGAHAVFAGTMGLPLISTLLGFVSFFGGSDDEPWDAETALKNGLADSIGVTATDVLMNGVSRLTPWDISGRVSINNLIVPKTREGLEGESQAQAVMTAALGPIGGIFVNILKGFKEISDGHGMRGVETMSPTFMRGPLRAMRFAEEGAQDKTGVSIQDDVSIAAILGQAAGFAPSEVRLATEGRSAVYDLQKKLDARRTSLMTRYARAKMDDDQDGMDEAWEEIQAFNQANPSRRINKIQAMQSYRKRQKRIDTAEHGMVVSRKKRDDLDEGRFAYRD